MKNYLNNCFDRVICINLLTRPDKKKNMQEKFDNLGINVEWFSAVPYGFAGEIVNSLTPSTSGFPRFNVKTPNEFGAALSHYTVIKSALIEGAENIFVFEDDVMFRKDFNNQFEKSFNLLPTDWNMFLLYSFMYNILPQNIRLNARWIKSYNSWSLMAYGMDRKAMQMYIDEMDKRFQIADLTSFYMQEKLNIYSSIPTLCIPNIELGSNIRGNNLNYSTTNTILNMGYSNDNFE